MTEFPRAAGGLPVLHFGTIGSTNVEALAQAQRGAPLWIVADAQTAGRGRRGRAWVSGEGNLHASLLLVDPAPPATAPGLCFVAALALHDALLDVAHGLAPDQLRLKWPNDLLLGGCKVAGILVEGVSLEAGKVATVAGFGVNCRRHPDGTEFPASDLLTAGFIVEPAALLTRLGESMQARLQEWDRGANFSSIRSAWLARASGLGNEIEVRLPGKTIGGRFESVDQTGALVLKLSNGQTETIAAGDVFPLTAA